MFRIQDRTFDFLNFLSFDFVRLCLLFDSRFLLSRVDLFDGIVNERDINFNLSSDNELYKGQLLPFHHRQMQHFEARVMALACVEVNVAKWNAKRDSSEQK